MSGSRAMDGIVSLPVSGGFDVAERRLLWFTARRLDVAVCEKRIKLILFL